MSSEEQAWSFTDWQCGMGIVDSCKNQKVDWDEPRSWQLVIDQLIPLTEVGIVFGMQYISSSIGPGTTKAMNAIRCMFNSGASSMWYYGAGGWLFIKYIGYAEELRSYLDEGYLYVCTCIYDLNGLKEMLGQSAESNAQFSVCSEAAARERIKSNEEKESYEAKQRAAAEQALVDAAKNTKITATIDSMKSLDGCNFREQSAADDLRCFAAVQAFALQSQQINNYWQIKVYSTGGTESTKNREEQTNAETARWVLEGTWQGLKELYPERYNDEGVLQPSCIGTAGTTWGAAGCESVISAWVSANSIPTAPCLGTEACNAAIKCYDGNDASGTEYTSTDSCDLVDLEYGYSQWQHRASITCTNPSDLQTLSGYANCVQGSKYGQAATPWVARSSFINQDQPMFRTIGDVISKVDAEENISEGNVKDADIKCLAADFRTVRTTSANCWPFWLEGSTIEIGVKRDGTAIKDEMMVWLTTELFSSCGTATDGTGADLIGIENCDYTQIPCNSSKIARLGILSSGGPTCIPGLTWKKKF